MKEFIEKYGRAIGSREIHMVQSLANDVSREKLAAELDCDYKALTMRITKVKKTVDVKSDAALVAFFYKHGLID